MTSKFILCCNIISPATLTSSHQSFMVYQTKRREHFMMQKCIASMSLYAPFYLLQRQLPVMPCASINHSKHRPWLICVLYHLRRRSYHSPNTSPCPGYLLHIPSSHPRSPPLILLPRQEAPESPIGKPQREGAERRDGERKNIRGGLRVWRPSASR